MAGFHYSGVDEVMLSMEEVAQIPPEVVDEMLNAQADVVVEAQRQAGRAMGVQDTGLTLRSIKKGKVKVKKDGTRVLYVTPSGTRKRGKKRVRNAEIAFVNEFGTRDQKARPFVRTGNESSAAQATRAAMEVYDRWLRSKDL